VPVISTDFYPTILDMAGLPLQPRQHVDGVSLAPLLKGGGRIDRDALFGHDPHYSKQGGFPGGAVRVGDWKLVERYEDGRVHLDNLREDPGERKDLAAEQAERDRGMQDRLHAGYRDVDAKLLQPKDGGPEP